MEELDKNLKELTFGLLLASVVLVLLALIMIRFEHAHPKNEIWDCVIFALKGCGHGWFFIGGRYSGKELFGERVSWYELKLKHTRDQFNNQKSSWDETLSNINLRSEALKRELEESKRKEEALLQELKAFKQTPSDANQNALKSFL